MSKDHPLMRAALSSEAEIREQLHNELDNALRGLSADTTMTNNLVASLEKQLAETQKRMDRLAGVRAQYGNLAADVRHCNETLEKTRAALTEAQGIQSAARSASLITRLDAPETGIKPLGPSQPVIVLGGTLGGFLAGMGLVFLALPLHNLHGHRLSDYLPFGRRASDRMVGMSAEDRQRLVQATLQSYGRRADDIPLGHSAEDPDEPATKLVCADIPADSPPIDDP
jgi:hypothetical protein